MKTIHAAALCAAVAVFVLGDSAVAADPLQLVAEDQVTVDSLAEHFRGAFIEVEINDKDDLHIEDGGVHTFISLDDDRNLLTMFSIWPMRSSVSEAQKLRLVNTLNDELILVRFTMTESGRLFCDYQLDYDGGLVPFHVINTYRTFLRVVKGAAARYDPDNIIGRD